MISINDEHRLAYNVDRKKPYTLILHYLAISQIMQLCFAGSTVGSFSATFPFCLLQPLAYRPNSVAAKSAQ